MKSVTFKCKSNGTCEITPKTNDKTVLQKPFVDTLLCLFEKYHNTNHSVIVRNSIINIITKFSCHFTCSLLQKIFWHFWPSIGNK